jgi:hypothetical protein
MRSVKAPVAPRASVNRLLPQVPGAEIRTRDLGTLERALIVGCVEDLPLEQRQEGCIPANSMTRAFPGEKAQLKRLGTLRTNGCRQWNGGFAVRAFFTLLVGEAPFYENNQCG